jgi:hypothetical protein
MTDDPKDPPDEFDEAEYDEWWGDLSDEDEAALKTDDETIEALGFDPDNDPEFQEMVKEAKLKRGVDRLDSRLGKLTER